MARTRQGELRGQGSKKNTRYKIEIIISKRDRTMVEGRTMIRKKEDWAKFLHESEKREINYVL